MLPFFGTCIIHILHAGNLNVKLRCQKVNPYPANVENMVSS